MGDVTHGSGALVPLDAGPSEVLGTPRPNAAYLAQLLAIKFDFPQTRCRRRATPTDAAAIYRGLALSDAASRPHRLLREL
jgi:hypothetical protein